MELGRATKDKGEKFLLWRSLSLWKEVVLELSAFGNIT